MKYLLAIIILFALWAQSCKTVYPNTMFKDIDSTNLSNQLLKLKEDYPINIGDEISFKLYTRNGAALVEPISTDITYPANFQTNNALNSFIVTNDGLIDLPLIGKIKVSGLTERYLKSYLEKEFEAKYQHPFVMLKVENRRAFVFKGTLGSVVTLNRTPTHIFEVLAKSGGLDRNLKSSDILIIRGDLRHPSIFKVNLSTFAGIQNSELYIQTNDIVYVPERQRTLYYSIQDIAPIITMPFAIITSAISSIFLIITLSR